MKQINCWVFYKDNGFEDITPLQCFLTETECYNYYYENILSKKVEGSYNWEEFQYIPHYKAN